MASLGKACFAGRHLSQPGTHCPRSEHCNYSVVLPVYYPLFFSLVYDHPVILIHNIIYIFHRCLTVSYGRWKKF
jgi:hypothetical protein